jgi:hypothetical protein
MLARRRPSLAAMSAIIAAISSGAELASRSTGTTTSGLSIESTRENLGEDSAALVVIADGEVLYDGLLDDTP